MTEKSFKQKLIEVDNCRFREIIEALHVVPECEKCYYFIPSITDSQQAYRCNVTGSCIAATLHKKLQVYLLRKIGIAKDRLPENPWEKRIIKKKED